MGRRKIEIQPLTDDRNRTVTFVKRKAGLFKKAYELAVLCQVDLAVIIVGNNNKVYEFSSVDTKQLIECYQQLTPHELKLPENYGAYKKKALLAHFDDDLPNVPVDDVGDLDFDLDSDGEPSRKRKKRHSSSTSSQTNNIPNHIKQEPQISQSQLNQASQIQAAQIQLGQPAQMGAIAQMPNQFSQIAVAPSGQQRAKNMPPMPAQPVFQGPSVPFHTDDAPQRPVLRVQIPQDVKAHDEDKTVTAMDSGDKKEKAPPAVRFGRLKSPDRKPSVAFSALPQPLPLGHYPPAILPTPVFNQVFNGAAPFPPPENDEKVKQSFAHGDTPVSALPSRYMNDIFPSPLNMYPAQEWPTGLTPFLANMPHYFVGMNGGLPMLGAYPSRTSIGRQPLFQQSQTQGQPQGLQQGQSGEYMAPYREYRK